MTELHLALVMAIDARLLVLDEPTLGLDILYRKQFYDSLLNDYFDHNAPSSSRPTRLKKIERTLTDVMFIDRRADRIQLAVWTTLEVYVVILEVDGFTPEQGCCRAGA